MNNAVIGSEARCRVLGAGLTLCLCAVVVALLWVASPVDRVAHAVLIKIGLIPTESGIGDLGFNWMAYQGLLRAETDLGVEGTVYTPIDPTDYAAKIQQCVDEGNALCVTVGFLMGDATLAAAQNNPATHFAIVDVTWDTYPANLRGMDFAEEQVGYLAGTLAGLMTGSDVIGGVGGWPIPPVVAFLEPYRRGAQCANPWASVVITYTNTFTDPSLGAQVAQAQMALGADVIFGAAGPTGNGAILAAAQAGAWAVGVDDDQWLSLFGSGTVPGSDKLLTSAMKRVDNAVYLTIADEVNGGFTPGTGLYDLSVDGVGLAPYHETDPFIPQAVKDAVEAVRQGLRDGIINPWKVCGMPGWRQSNEDGFGDPNNGSVPSLAVFGDHLYAGTWNWDGTALTFQIWRTADGLGWEQVASELGGGAAHLIAFDGFLYAGTWDGAVWRTPDGLAWTPVITDGFGDPNNGIARFSVFGDMLYATTWSVTGTEVWRTPDGETWTQFGSDGLGDPNNGGAIASEIFGDALYLGIGNWVTGAQLWRTDGVTWEPLVTDAFGDPANAAVSSLAAFGGSLYAGLWNESGVQVWRSPDGESWQKVVGGGFGNPAACRENALEVFEGHLYLVVQNDNTGLEVWRTANGTDWEQVSRGGFGDSLNIWSYWDNATTVFGGSLYIATNHADTGGEVWQTVRYRVYLPVVLASYVP
jgi:basic membrane lipoprotein Med (substrate-binding protein (PBP1-ABC) superfamily)